MLPTIYAGRCLHVNNLQLFANKFATNVYFAIKVEYFTIALFSLYLAHLNTFIYL